MVYFDKSDSELECDEDGDDEASAPAARHVRAASAARGTAKGGYIVDGTSDEGSDDDEAEASAATRTYVTSAASEDDEAVATAERRACAAMVARHADGGRLRQRRTRTTTTRTRTMKAARRTGVNEAASDAKGNDVASRDDDTEVDSKRATDKAD